MAQQHSHILAKCPNKPESERHLEGPGRHRIDLGVQDLRTLGAKIFKTRTQQVCLGVMGRCCLFWPKSRVTLLEMTDLLGMTGWGGGPVGGSRFNSTGP